jgi:dTDP-4-dehydrorhamnose 3,5-epimerase
VQVILYDLREGSPTVGNLISAYLGILPNGEHNHQGIYIPPGVAHGFAALSDMTITYLVDSYYNPEDELGVAWNDPDINAPWDLVEPTISERDSHNPLLSSISPSLMPKG